MWAGSSAYVVNLPIAVVSNQSVFNEQQPKPAPAVEGTKDSVVYYLNKVIKESNKCVSQCISLP